MKLSNLFEKILNEEERNFLSKDTGLPKDIWVDSGSKSKHENSPRIKFYDENRMEIPLTISDNPEIPKNVVQNYGDKIKIKAKELNMIKRWVILNKDDLLLLYNKRISNEEFYSRMKQIK